MKGESSSLFLYETKTDTCSTDTSPSLQLAMTFITSQVPYRLLFPLMILLGFSSFLIS